MVYIVMVGLERKGGYGVWLRVSGVFINYFLLVGN